VEPNKQKKKLEMNLLSPDLKERDIRYIQHSLSNNQEIRHIGTHNQDINLTFIICDKTLVHFLVLETRFDFSRRMVIHFSEACRLKKINVDIEEFKRLHADGMTNKEIGNFLGFSQETARKIRCNLGLLPLAIGRKPIVTTVIDNDELKRLYSNGLSDKQIGSVFGVSNKTILNHRKSLGLSKCKKWGSSTSKIEKFKKLHSEGLNDKEIANVLGLCRDTARKIRHELGLPSQALGRKHFDIEKLKHLFAEGFSDKEIGTVFGVSAYTVYERRRDLGLSRRKQQTSLDNINVDEFKKLYSEGMNDKKIGKVLGVHCERVKEIRNQLGLSQNQTRSHEKKRELYDAGMSDGQIARTIKGSKQKVAAWRRNHGLPPKNKDDALIDALDTELLKPEENEPIQPDSESLFCDTEFLEKLVGKALKKKIVVLEHTLKKINVDELKQLFAKGLSDAEIGKVFGVCDRTIANRRRCLGLYKQIPRQNKRKDIDIDELKQLYHAGMSDAKIGKVINISQSAVFRIRHHLGLAPNRGRRHWEMRELYDLGLSDGRVAEILKVRKHSVTTWRQSHELPANDPEDAITDELDVELSKSEEEKPIKKDLESLFYDTEFLENYLGKDIKGKSV
jgi:DNA-binding CsgD family transcriptional regulator/transcriptional regulator with XRE-family HTH domain